VSLITCGFFNDVVSKSSYEPSKVSKFGALLKVLKLVTLSQHLFAVTEKTGKELYDNKFTGK